MISNETVAKVHKLGSYYVRTVFYDENFNITRLHLKKRIDSTRFTEAYINFSDIKQLVSELMPEGLGLKFVNVGIWARRDNRSNKDFSKLSLQTS